MPRSEIHTLSATRLALAALVLAAATIAGAWGFQLIGGYIPCELCLEERIPFYAGIPILLVALLALRQSHTAGSRLLLGLAAVVFLVGAGLGTYHSGVELGWWQGPDACTSDGEGATSVGDLLSQLQTVQVVRCDEVQWRFLGLTFANYNVLVSLALAGLSFLAARKA